VEDFLPGRESQDELFCKAGIQKLQEQWNKCIESAEIMEKNKPTTVVVLRFFIYDTKNFWVNPRTVRQLASFWYNEFK